MSNAAPAGWYADPRGVIDHLRWWDGEDWTSRTTHDPSSEPPATSDGPPSGPPRAASPLTVALIPTGSKLMVSSALVLTMVAVLVLVDEIVQRTHVGRAGAVLESSASPTLTQAAALLLAALLLKGVRGSSVTGVQRALRGVSVVGAAALAGLSALGCAVTLVDVAAGGALNPGAGYAIAAIVLDRLAVLVLAAAGLWLLAGEPLARFTTNARIQLADEEPSVSESAGTPRRRVKRPPSSAEGEDDV